jgi:hypothetical protein
VSDLDQAGLDTGRSRASAIGNHPIRRWPRHPEGMECDMTAKIRFFPVGNADTLRIDLADGRKILVDYADMRDPDDEDDLRCDLPEELRRGPAAITTMRSASRTSTMIIARASGRSSGSSTPRRTRTKTGSRLPISGSRPRP